MSFTSGLLLPAMTSGAPAALPYGTQGRPQVGIPNPLSGLGKYVVGHVVDAFTALLRALSDDFLRQLAAPVADYVLHTPDLLAEATLRQYWLVSLGVLASCVGLLFAIAGLAIIPGPSSRLAMLARETLGIRLAGGLLTAAVSLPLVALEVGLANRVVDVFIGTGFSAGHNPLWAALKGATHGDASAGLALLVTVTVGVVLLVALVVLGIIRWATLWLLIVLAPLAMGLSVLPAGGGVVRLWWRLQLTAVLVPIANAVLLGTYVAMFTSTRSGLVGALSGVAVLALMTKIPGWAAGAAVGVEGHEVSARIRRSYRAGRTGGHAMSPTGSGSAGRYTAVAAAGAQSAHSPCYSPAATTHSPQHRNAPTPTATSGVSASHRITGPHPGSPSPATATRKPPSPPPKPAP